MSGTAAATAARFGRVGVLFGGGSAERGVSLMSGRRVLAALRTAGVDAYPHDPHDDGLGALCERHFDRCFIVLHGRGGEDGTIQGFLETLGIPYTGSGVLGCSVAMNKVMTKRIWRGLGLPTTPWVQLSRHEAPPTDLFEQLGSVLAVKPVHEGSTLGLSRVNSPDVMPEALAHAFEFDDEVMVEPWVSGREYTGTVLAGEALPLIGIEPAVDFYDYDAKYVSEATRYHCPCGLEDSEEQRLRRMCRDAFAAVGGRGWGRVDLIRDHDGRPWLLEANTVPGMTEHSLVPMAARAVGMDFESLVVAILTETLAEGADGH